MWLESFLLDVRYRFLQRRKAPGFTLTAVLTLALGIGANAAIFTLVNAVLLRTLPVIDPKSLARPGDRADCCQNSGPNLDGDYSMFSTATYEQMKRSTPDFEELAFRPGHQLTLATDLNQNLERVRADPPRGL